MGSNLVVYGSPLDISTSEGNLFDDGEWRYLGWDINGNLYRNWLFRSDSRATLNVGKNWVKTPWNTTVGESKKITPTPMLTSHPDARKWLESIVDPYRESPTFIQSYNKRTGKGWTGETLKEYVIIQQIPTDFSPGIVQMWNIWKPDGSWWYEMFYIPPLNKLVVKKQPDLLISTLVSPADAWVGDSVPIKITTKNQGTENSGAFTVGIVGTNIKSEIISNIPPGQIKTVTVNLTSTSSGIKSFTAKTDFGEAVAESNENNNTKDFKIAFNKKNEPTTPIAIISHKEGDHRTTPEITMKPATKPMLDDKLSYSPGKEAITLKEWKYKTPVGKMIARKPTAKDFAAEGKYIIELRVTNSAKKVSEWAQLIINIANQATPNPSPSTSPEPTPTPKPDLKADIEFDPPSIIAGEKSSLINRSKGLNGYTWKFTDNLSAVLPNTTDYEFMNITYPAPGYYTAEITVTDEFGGSHRDGAVLRVIDPKPVAIVSGITRVIQGRPLERPYNLLNSYTPLEDRGEKIDFSRSEMRYKRVGDAAYTNGWFNITPTDLGEYSIEGKVYDTTGRVSDWDELIMEVVPDAPPTVRVVAPEESYRGNGFMLYIDAESPDGDILKYLSLEERYDRDGDENFEEEAWRTLYDGKFKTIHSLNYSTVGKRQYRAVVTEDFGMKGYSGIAATDILNYAPSANFNVFGTTQQPGQGEDSGPPVTNYTTQSIFRSWTSKLPYKGGNAQKAAWKADATTLSTKNGVYANFSVGYPNSGNGANSRTKYQLASEIVAKPTWSVPNTETVFNKVFGGNRLYSYKQDYNSPNFPYTFYERNSITGELLRTVTFDTPSNFTLMQIGGDETFYFSDGRERATNPYLVKIARYDKNGVYIDTISMQSNKTSPSGLGSEIGPALLELSSDGEFMYVASKFSYDVPGNYYDGYRNQLRFFKYSLKTKSLVWEAPGETLDRGYITNINMTEDDNGDVYFTYNFEDRYSSGLAGLRGYVVQVKQDGITRTHAIGGAAGLSHASISDSKKYVYVNYVELNGSTIGNTFFEAIYNGTNYNGEPVFENAFVRSIVRYQDDSGLSFAVVAPNANPLVFASGFTYSQGRTHQSYNAFFNIYGDQSGGFESESYSANLGKIFINQHNQIIYPVFNPVGITFDPGTPRKITATLYNASTNSVIAATPYSGPPVVSYEDRSGTSSTPILPDGSIYVFYDKNVMPFVPAKAGGSIKEIDANTVEITNDDWGGLLYDAGSAMKNYALEFHANVSDMKNDKVIGAAFQIQNEKNMYAMEWSKNALSLYRVVNGAKTLLQSTPMTRTAFNTYPIKVESVNGIQRVYVNYAKVLEVADGTYIRGYAGLMSLGQSNAVFSNVKKTNYGDTYTEQTYDSVLVNDPISYEKLFNDIEKDPMAAEEWSYSHNPNFFENPERLSVHNGKTYGSTINSLERAGVYEITFRAKDNPGLSAYRKWSEPVKKLLYVHRRPVAQPDVRFTGKVFAEGEALNYETFDTSYDPDIAHILSDKLFRTRWADQSTWTAGKREYYNRPGVELIVQEQVRDIHGAWSYWGQTIVYKDGIPPVNQTKPVMTITVPTGTTPSAPTVLIKEPTIRWTYYDAQNDPQERYRLTLTYVDNNETALYIEHEGNAVTYPMLVGNIVPGRVVKVQGQVYSAGVWSNMSNSRYFVLDLPPQTYLLSFNGPDGNHPIYTNTNRPQLRVFTVDPENHPIKAIDYEVFKASSGAMVMDTNSATTAANYTTTTLAEGLHYWRARANDSYVWGPYSSNGFFFVDTVKPADVKEQLIVEPTAVTVNFNAFYDAEPSSGHATRTFYLQKVNADGSVTNIDLNGDGTTEYSIPLALSKQSYKVAGLISGQAYRLTVLDYDVAGNEGHYEYIHFVTNRPPTADFDWMPKPVYEGDMTSFLSNVSDADGNTLTIAYELTSPLGVKNSYFYTVNGPSYPVKGPSLRLTAVGLWSMKITVSDGIADPVSLTKTLQVLPLQVNGYVRHTELWDQHRKAFNLKQSGDENLPRGYSVFWAGEKFILEADTTLTGTATKADRVEVRMSTYETSLAALNAGQSSWKGELWDASFAKLAKGTLTFTFSAYYNNGTVKTKSVDITIEGQTIDRVGVHRVQ
ncbi:Athe_2463 domain-containing protein [Bacillus sp. FJAT-28004]|uniref:Athe_2463 domain-containing protein n=1 Tax=Bacillus sp. FJAT-28004 TaxID=1679165 RepID=UPI0039C8CD96